MKPRPQLRRDQQLMATGRARDVFSERLRMLQEMLLNLCPYRRHRAHSVGLKIKRMTLGRGQEDRGVIGGEGLD